VRAFEAPELENASSFRKRADEALDAPVVDEIDLPP
jgi:hypothetical protein